jgi:TolB-like protein
MRLSLVLLCALLVPASALAAPPAVAVMYFDYQGKDEELALLKKGLASMLISDLAGQEAFNVIERERLEDVLGELKLQGSAKIDQASAVKAGKLLGARYLVLGGYFDVLKTLRVDARVVEVETGKVLKSTGASGKPDEFLSIEQKLAGALNTHLNEVLTRVETKVKTKPDRPAKTEKTDKNESALATHDAGVAAQEQNIAKRRARPPKQLKAATAVEYGRALSALDRRDVKEATASLKKVVAEAPDFELASLDLNRLMKP